MGDIWRPSDSGSRALYPGAFIQYINGREPMIHELWCHGIDRLCREVHPAARIDIPAGTIRDYVTKYLSANGQRNKIIGELSMIGRVKFIALYEIWVSRLMYIANARAP